MPDELKHEAEEIIGRVRQGEHLETHETRRVRKDGTVLDVSLTISPIGSDSGYLYGASVIARDITSERRRRSAREFLITATRDLDASLDPVETARNIVAKAVPDLAEVCVIDFLRGDRSKEGTAYRIRASRLPDFVNAEPVFVGPPVRQFADNGQMLGDEENDDDDAQSDAGSDSSVEFSDLGDDEMMLLDDKLAEVFRQRIGAARDQKEAK